MGTPLAFAIKILNHFHILGYLHDNTGLYNDGRFKTGYDYCITVIKYGLLRHVCSYKLVIYQ